MRRAGITAGVMGALTALQCDGSPSGNGLESSRAITYGTVTGENGQSVTMMGLTGHLAFGTCDRPMTGSLSLPLREDVAVTGNRYRKDILLDFTPNPRAACAHLSFRDYGETFYNPVEGRMDVTMEPSSEPPDSARMDVDFSR